MLLAVSALHAQDPASPPSATPSPEKPPGDGSSAPASPSPTPDLTQHSPKMKEEINLADSPAAESLEITPPPDSPDPEKAEEIKEPLPGEEEPHALPAITGTVDVTAKDEGKTVHASVGNLVRITLESHPSTGYNWELRDFEFGVSVFNSSDLVARHGGNVLFGAPGDTVITLQAVGPGEQDIKLVYRRLWEPPDQIAATFSFRLVVTPPRDAPPAPETTPAP